MYFCHSLTLWPSWCNSYFAPGLQKWHLPTLNYISSCFIFEKYKSAQITLNVLTHFFSFWSNDCQSIPHFGSFFSSHNVQKKSMATCNLLWNHYDQSGFGRPKSWLCGQFTQCGLSRRRGFDRTLNDWGQNDVGKKLHIIATTIIEAFYVMWLATVWKFRNFPSILLL